MGLSKEPQFQVDIVLTIWAQPFRFFSITNIIFPKWVFFVLLAILILNIFFFLVEEKAVNVCVSVY
jgi:hypothetical protein